MKRRMLTVVLPTAAAAFGVTLLAAVAPGTAGREQGTPLSGPSPRTRGS